MGRAIAVFVYASRCGKLLCARASGSVYFLLSFSLSLSQLLFLASACAASAIKLHKPRARDSWERARERRRRTGDDAYIYVYIDEKESQSPLEFLSLPSSSSQEQIFFQKRVCIKKKLCVRARIYIYIYIYILIKITKGGRFFLVSSWRCSALYDAVARAKELIKKLWKPRRGKDFFRRPVYSRVFFPAADKNAAVALKCIYPF